MTTTVEICNRALDHLTTKAVIQSLDENSKEANACRRHYDDVLRATIRLHDWGFSTTFTKLARIEAQNGKFLQTGGWLFIYKYPIDCLKIWELWPNVDAQHHQQQQEAYQSTGYPGKRKPVPFRRGVHNGSNVIYTNLPQAWARHAFHVKDPNLFDPMFVDAMSYALAAAIAKPVTGRRDDMRQMNEQRDRVVLEAQGADANEGSDDMNFEAGWIEDRA